jgi:hypothetical protein
MFSTRLGATANLGDIHYLYLRINQKEDTIRKLLRFLKGIGVVEQFIPKTAQKKTLRPRMKWRLTPKLKMLSKAVEG